MIRRAHTTTMTQQQARTQLTLFLCNVPDGLLKSTTVEHLQARYRLPRKELEYALTVAKQKRGLA